MLNLGNGITMDANGFWSLTRLRRRACGDRGNRGYMTARLQEATGLCGRMEKYCVLLVGFLDKTFFDAGFLTCEIAQVVKFRTTNLTIFVNCDRLDEWRFHWEDTLNSDTV